MKMKIVVLVACMAAGAQISAEETTPKDVQGFIRNADACDHFAGEFDGGLSERQQKEIERSVVRYCQPAQKQLKLLTKKYKHDPKMTVLIQSHANDSVTSFR